HLDVGKAAERPEALDLWRDFVLRLSSAPVVSIAKIRGRTRGIGNEFVLACDMRFASRQSALFGQPEIGVGLVPGGGAMEWLPRSGGQTMTRISSLADHRPGLPGTRKLSCLPRSSQKYCYAIWTAW